MVRKKRVQRLDGRQRSLVENALHCANPPEPTQREVVELPPMLLYIWKLLFKELNKTNTEKVYYIASMYVCIPLCVYCCSQILRQMRKLDWNDPEVM